MNQHGIFISYKRNHPHLAGRIYDYFKFKGLDPFMDEYSMHQANRFPEKLLEEVRSAPYFLCVLTEDGFQDLISPNYSESYYFKEIHEAFQSDREIFILRDESVTYERFAELPDEIRDDLKDAHSETIPANNNDFTNRLETIVNTIRLDKLNGVINWREYSELNANVLMLPKQKLHRLTATFENKFGVDFMRCVREKKEYAGPYHIKEINMACYAASSIFTAKQDMLDRKAVDSRILSDVFKYLLRDPDFHFRLIVNAPEMQAAKEAVKFRKLGNSSFEEHPEAVFLSSFSSISNLMNEEPYHSAKKRKHFALTLTECSLPYSIFHIVYKNGWEEFNHVKIDLYSFNLDSSEERRTMVIFEKDDKQNYDFFVHQFEYLRSDAARKNSKKLIERKEKDWLSQWEELKKTISEEL